jgi:archaellum component FlaC
MSTKDDDIPSLTLRVLQNIQGELVGLRKDVGVLNADFRVIKDDIGSMKDDIGSMKDDIGSMKDDIRTLKGDVRTLDARFENFLTFVGRDVQDLKLRVSALEEAQRRS